MLADTHNIAPHIADELRHMKEADDAYFDMHTPAVTETIRKLRSGRKLERFQIKQAIGTEVELLKRDPNVLWFQRNPSPRSNSAYGVVETLTSSVVNIGKNNGLPFLNANRTAIAPKRFEEEVGRAPLSIRPSAIEKYSQSKASRETSLFEIFGQIDANLGFLCCMFGPAEFLPQKKLALPVGDGLIIGEVIVTPRAPRSNMIIADEFTVKSEDDSNIEPFMLLSAHGYCLSVEIAEILPARDLDHDQRVLHHALEDIANDNRGKIEALSEICFFPITVEDAIADCVDLQDQVANLMENEDMARAMGNQGSFEERRDTMAMSRMKMQLLERAAMAALTMDDPSP